MLYNVSTIPIISITTPWKSKKASFLSYVSCLFLVIFLGCHRCLVSFSAQLSQKKYSYVKQATDAKSLLSYHMYCGKGGLKSESTGRFSNCPKNVPKTILIYYIQYTLSFYNNEPSKNKHFLILLYSLARNSQEPKLKRIFEIP